MIYVYAARTGEGKVVRGTEEAAGEAEAVKLLQNRGFFIISISDLKTSQQQPASFAGRRSRREKKRHRRLKPQDSLFFIGELATLLDAGIPIIRAIDVIAEQVESQTLYRILDDIKSDIRAGSTLKDCFARHPKHFPAVWVSLIEAGEAGGNLPLVLRQLAAHLEASINLTKKVTSALVYPSVLVTVAMGALLVFMLKIIPIFSKLFESFHAKLPPLTQAIVTMSNFLQHYFVHLAVGGALLFFAFRRYAKTVMGRRTLDRLSLHAPIFGPLVRDSIIARITINLATLIKSGVNIIKSLEITSSVAGNWVYESALANVSHEIQQGKSLSVCLQDEPLFPSLMVNMIAIGEESGKLPDMIAKVAKYYSDRVDVFVSRMSVLIEPIILIFVGGIVGLLVVSMFMPIFSMTSSLH